MKELVDIQVALATAEDMDVFDEDKMEMAAECLNTILHMLYDSVDDDINASQLERMIQHVWDTWREDSYLLAIDEQDLRDWVDHLIASWDDAPIE